MKLTPAWLSRRRSRADEVAETAIVRHEVPFYVGEQSRSLTTFQEAFIASEGRVDTTYFGAWSIPSAWRASTLLGGLIGSACLEAWRAASPVPVKVSPQPTLMTAPVTARTNIEVMSAWVHDYLFHGNAIAIVADRDPVTGWPTALIPVPAAWVSVTPLPQMSNYDFATLSGNMLYRIGSLYFTSDNVLHVRGPSQPGALRGVGVIEAQLHTFETAHNQLKQAEGVSKHGVPTGVLQASDPDVTPEELASGKSSWLAAQANAATIAALPPGVEFKPLAWNPTDMQMLEARQFTDGQMALAFGLPASMLNAESGGSSTYKNLAQDDLSLLKFTVNLIMQRFEQEWSTHLPRGNFAKFDRTDLLEADQLTRYQMYQVGIASGFLTADEVRAAEGLPPLPSVPVTSPEVSQALQIATAAPTLVQNPGLVALVNELRLLNGKPPLAGSVPPPAPVPPQFGDESEGDESE